jgi:glyoxylase-like metal-dependent hydrolase (beta-lactamase superfamily II)
VQSKGQKLLVWGDTVHVAPVQFPRPDIPIKYDFSQDAAVRSRTLIFEEAAISGDWVAAAHISFPGIGHVRARGTGYEWVPANYGLMRAAFGTPPAVPKAED